jgi:signal transduction histidine kinase
MRTPTPAPSPVRPATGPGPDLFAGGGEVGRLMAAYDWSRSQLGAPATWPHSLRTVVRILLTSRYAMWMGWGPELAFLYNDAYAAMTLGVKHPWALGRPAREVWAEIWPQVGPRIEQVLGSGEATWDERLRLFLERSGYREETFHTFSYSPLPDDTGRIYGNFCVVTEETERVIDERRLAALGVLGSALAPARSDTDVFRGVERAAAGAPDLPFLFVYLFDEAGQARLAARGNVDASVTWPADLPMEALARLWCGETGADIDPFATSRACTVPAEARTLTAVWDAPSEQALLVPLRLSGQQAPAGVVIAGLNPFRRLDDKYVNFVTLFTGQVAAGLTSARAYDEERRRAEALAALDRAKTAFFSNISHEFRTPLTLMLGPTEDALATPDAALTGEDLRTVHRNQVRLLKLVNALLDFSRLEAGRTQARFEAVDLAAETTGLASVFRSAIERAGLRLEVAAAPLDATVFLDRTLWERVVLNLLSNAVKFTFEGRIRVEVRRDGSEAVVTVADTGVGIPAAALPRVFDRFQRVEGTRARTHEGSGIGLALVHELVHLHGGRVSVESEEGRGTTFTIRLRLGRDHLPADAVLTDAQAGTDTGAEARAAVANAFVSEAERWLPDTLAGRDRAPAAASSAGRVLIADDNADMREYAARLLRSHWEVETVADGQEALARARANPPDLILSDVMMPRLDGFALLRALRADVRTATVPVIMLSARAGDEARIDGLEAGADDYLVKPFSARELIVRVATHAGLSRARRQTQVERDRLKELLSEVPAIINFLSGPDLVFEYVHPLAVQALGGRDVLGKPVLEAVPEYRGQPFIDELHAVYRTGEIRTGRAIKVDIDRSGTGQLDETYWDYTYLPMRNDAGEIAGVMTFDIEVTDRVRTQQRLERATRAKDEFLAMLGHELRNPLAPILTALQLMTLKGATSVSQERSVIERQTRHLARLVDDLLDVARIAQGRIELKREVVTIADAVAKAIEIAAPLIEGRGQRIELTVPAAGLTVHADAARLAQAIANLLTNAAKYSEPGTTIRILARREGGDVVVAVTDEGIGIDAALLPRVFDLFVQGGQTSARSQGGLGLGLAIVRNIMELHGGSATASSAGLGEGSEFVLRLPALVDASAAGASPDPARAASGLRRLDVLIVDDNADAVEMLSTYLQMRGHRVRTAADGPAALAAVTAATPDVALLDIGLPVMDGYELAARIRRDARAAATRLVAVTGYGQAEDKRRADAAGFDDHLVKPVDIGDLERVLAAVR